jgi:hypothetical protein
MFTLNQNSKPNGYPLWLQVLTDKLSLSLLYSTANNVQFNTTVVSNMCAGQVSYAVVETVMQIEAYIP